MANPGYEAAVKETFETKPLKTVLMIDDQFPTFSDLVGLVEGQEDKNDTRFRQRDRALALYRGFQRRHMICDVENNVSDVEAERFRKSDLIILDYNLGPGEQSNERSIGLLRALAASKHFNTVVVYTDDDLDKVWLEIIASISPSWTVSLGEEAQTVWLDLLDRNKVPDVIDEAVRQYAKRKRIRDVGSDVLRESRSEIEEAGVAPKHCNDVLIAMIHTKLAEIAGNNPVAQEGTAIGDYAGGSYWVQFRNTFVAIHKKGDLTDDEDDPAGVMRCLGDALLSWKPNLVQILVSEIQNVLELEALVTEDSILRLPSTHAALVYYLLSKIGGETPTNAGVFESPLKNVIDKIVDGIRLRLVSYPELLDLAGKALEGELVDADLVEDRWPSPFSKNMLEAAVKLTRTDGLTKHPDVIFRLNHFFSTEPVTRSHLTTGTIFFSEAKDEYYVVATPACDLEPRPPSSEQKWAHAIHPFTPFTAIHLTSVNRDAALVEATNGKHIFLDQPEKALRLLSGSSNQPTYEYFFAQDMGQISEEDGKKVFSASRVEKLEENGLSTKSFVLGKFEVVAQLREVNANRVLQLAGQHASRIGLDLLDLPQK